MIRRFDEAAAAAARARQDTLTKPRGSLGALEDVVVRLAGVQGAAVPVSRPAVALLFASDHEVVRHGVSAYPQEVTAAMVANFARGGAAASVLARTLGVPLVVTDVGVRHPYDARGAAATVTRARCAALRGGDLREARALDETHFEAALEAGRAAIDEHGAGAKLVILGEMGIGNTTCASAVVAALLGISAERAIGPGTGLDRAGLARKQAVLEDALAALPARDARAVLMGVSGPELVALVGAAERAIERGAVVLVDGFIVSAAMLALERLRPGAARAMLFAHRSAEPAHALVLEALGGRPLLELGLRLGEGSGALTALPLVELACALHAGMATFAEASVPDRGA